MVDCRRKDGEDDPEMPFATTKVTVTIPASLELKEQA
jgi:hypothetical protein